MNLYECRIDSQTQVYDGDTIKDVRIEVNIPALEVGFYLVRDLRISGIDTPEKRPKKAGRTEESRVREKQAAAAARNHLVSILAANDFQFKIADLSLGKYAGRILAELWVENEKVSDLMIASGHAKPYDGGRKPQWDW